MFSKKNLTEIREGLIEGGGSLIPEWLWTLNVYLEVRLVAGDLGVTEIPHEDNILC